MLKTMPVQNLLRYISFKKQSKPDPEYIRSRTYPTIPGTDPKLTRDRPGIDTEQTRNRPGTDLEQTRKRNGTEPEQAQNRPQKNLTNDPTKDPSKDPKQI